MTDETVPTDLAARVLKQFPGGTKEQWGAEMDRLVTAEKSAFLKAWRRGRMVASLGSFVAQTRARRDADRAPKITHNGEAMSMTPTISVNGQQKLWTEVTPSQWLIVVEHEQSIVDGRHQSNRARWQVADLIQSRADLMALPTIGDVIAVLGLDPDDLAIGDGGAS